MTWDEFKSIVDEKLAEIDSDGSVEIWYINIDSVIRSVDELSIIVEDSNGLAICG